MDELAKPISQLNETIAQFNKGAIELRNGLTQTLALLTASDDIQRRVLKASESGVLNVCSARIQDIVHVTAVGDNDTWHGDNLKTTEVIVYGHPSNTGLVWVRTDKTATVNNAFPVAANTGISIPIDNLKNVHLLIEANGEKAIVLYTR